MDEKTKQSVLNAARQGDREALGELLAQYFDTLCIFSNRRFQPTRGPKTASDEVQQAYVLAIESFPSFKGKSLAEFESWLKAILRHSLSNSRRAEHASKRDSRRKIPFDTLVEPTQTLEKHDPENALIQQELIALIPQLPVHYSKILLRDLAGIPRKDIASEFSMTERAVSSLIYRAVTRLRDLYLGKEGG